MEINQPDLNNPTPSRHNTNWRAWLPTRGNVLFILVVAGALLLYVRTAGAVPPAAPAVASTSAIPYQGRLADAGGNPLNGSYAMTFRLYNVVSGGSALWTEIWSGGNNVAVSGGLFSIMLGSLTPLPQNAFAANSSLWLGITVATDSEMVPRVQLGSAPFALTVPDGSITQSKLAPGVLSLGTVYTITLNSWVETTISTVVHIGTINLPAASNLWISGSWTLQNNAGNGSGMAAVLQVDGVNHAFYGLDYVTLQFGGLGTPVARNYYLPSVAAGSHSFNIYIDQLVSRVGEQIGVGPGTTMWIWAIPVGP